MINFKKKRLIPSASAKSIQTTLRIASSDKQRIASTVQKLKLHRRVRKVRQLGPIGRLYMPALSQSIRNVAPTKTITLKGTKVKQLKKTIDNQSVFLNIPFDKSYSALFVALIGGLVGLGLKPRCVLEIPSRSGKRLSRILGLIKTCGTSIHDLSRVTLDNATALPRFNMPFELGLAVAIGDKTNLHRSVVFEEKKHRLQVTLSDFNGYDPCIHHSTQKGILKCVLNEFSSAAKKTSLQDLQNLLKKLNSIVKKELKQADADTPFEPHLFKLIVGYASELAKDMNLIS